MPRHVFAIEIEGCTFTRSTDAAYTHAVVSRRTPANFNYTGSDAFTVCTFHKSASAAERERARRANDRRAGDAPVRLGESSRRGELLYADVRLVPLAPAGEVTRG